MVPKSKIERPSTRGQQYKVFPHENKKKTSRNKIKNITGDDGITYNSHEEISNQLTKDFKERFKVNNNCHFNPIKDFLCIKKDMGNQDNNLLTKEVTNEEIISTIKEMGLNKA